MPIVVALSPLEIVAVAGIAVCIGAAAMLMMRHGSDTLFVRPFTEVVSRIPFVGGLVGDIVRNALQSVMSFVGGWINSVIGPLVDLVSGIVQWIHATIVTFVGSIEWAVSQIVLTAGRVQYIIDYATSMIDYVWDIALDGYHAAQRVAIDLGNLVARVQWVAYTLMPKAIRDAITAVTAVFTVAIASATNTLRQQIAAVSALFTAGLSAAVAMLRNELAVAVTVVSGYIAVERAARTASDALITGAVAVAVNTLGLQLTDVQLKVNTLIDANVIVRIAALDLALATTIAKCVNPVCGFFGPQMSILNLLLDGATLALLTAAVAEAVANPEAAANATAGAARGIYSVASGIVGVAGI